MTKLWLALLSALLGLAPAQAQNFSMPPPAGIIVGGFAVVGTCGAQTLVTTLPAVGTIDSTGALCVNASVSVSASITGFPTVQSTGTPISVSTVSATGTLPGGTVVVATNAGTTNNAFCKLGASATTSDQLIAPNSWFAFTVGANTQLSCITSTSTTTVNMVGGSGLPTGAGGGGGGSGGGGSVTQGTTPWVVGQATGTNLHAVIDSGSTTAVTQPTGTNLHAVIDTGSTTAVTQATSSNLKAQVDPLTAASWGIGTSTQNSTVATNGQLALAQFNTTPTTITSTNMSPLQLDANANLKVNVVAGGAGGGAVTQATSPWVVAGNGTAGTAASGVLSIQGITSMTPVVADISADLNTNITLGDAISTGTFSIGAPVAGVGFLWNGTTYDRQPGTAAGGAKVNVGQVNGVTVLTGTGATGTGAQRVTVSTDQATNAGAALDKGGVGVVNGGSRYQAVAASQTAAVLQSSTGAAGDYLSHCVIYPTSTSPGVVTVFDGSNTAPNSAILFPGGATSLSNLAPISIPVGAISRNGAWEVTTGASVSVVCYGSFS